MCLHACQQKVQAAQPTLSDKELVELIVDVALVEGDIQLSANDTEKESKTQQYYPQLYKRHGITAKEFQQNMDALMQNPQRSDTLYKIAKTRLEEMTK